MGLVRRNVVVLLGGAAMTVLVGVPQVAAQSQGQNGKFVTLLERLVIGAGAPKVAVDTPQAVTVVDQADIDAAQATTVKDVLETVPGVSVIGSDRIFGESFNIRGIGTAENSGDESRIIVTVDGAKKFYEQYRMGSFFSDPELYKQVEVLRGPASSTLYGSGALAGVINFTTKDGSDFIKDGQTGAIRVKGQYSSNGNGTLMSGLVAHKFNEGFDILATGNWRRSNDFDLANGGVLSGSAFDAYSGLIKGTARFGDQDDQKLSVSYQRWSSKNNDQDYAQTGTVAAFGTVDRDVVDQTAVLHYENAATDNPWVDLKANLSYSDTYVKQTNSAIGSIGDAEYGYKTWQASLENTSEFSGESWQNFLTYGAQLSYQDRIAFTTLPLPNTTISTHPEGKDTRLGIYAQDEFILNDQLTIITGGRADFVWQKPEVTTKGQHEIQDVALSPKVAALYKFNDNVSIFGSVAHTERLPTLDELYQYNSVKGPSLNLEKEQSNSYEAGFALTGYELLFDGDQATVKVTGFYNDLTNLIESSPSVVGNPYFRNVGKATIYGVEVEGSYESEFLFGRLAYAAMVGTNDVTGKALTSVPGHKLQLTVGARNPEYNLEYGAKATIVASTETGVLPVTGSDASTPGYATFDIFANWKPESGPLAGTEAQFSIENIFNADYRDNQTPDRSKGRTFKLTLAKQFDY
ncbi:TonB-dependent receptor domain-containing protein [Paradevosia shaoguanensis]|uniref:TonB-dependent receptor domain-containing protein n=1 Tax=Paradevosia shaoguanensis TaxID=1335043 RepID=UPI000455B9B9|nr:TonB-dependent receptor [Paradevosia shaoguanensis]CDP51030.1 TonB-dependent hemin, ferrichrome receptor [Devosia sp. DBB001]